MNLLVSCLISTVGAALADTQTHERGLIYPLSIQARTGAKANYWRPQSIPGTKIATRGYATGYAEARLSLFEYLAIERVRYESTVGTPGVQREFSEIEATDDKIRARIFDGILALYIPSFRENPFRPLPKHGVLWGPGFRLQNEVYNGRLIQTQPKIVVQDHFDETVEEADLVTPAGQSHRFVTEFRQEVYGVVARYSTPIAYGHFLAGLGHLRFRKPWSPSFSSTNNVFFSTIEAYGFAMNGEWHSRDSGVIDNFLEIDFLYGGGDFQILDDTKLSSLVSDDFSVGCIAGGVTGGVEYDWIDMDGVDLYTTVFAGIWASHFFISYSEEEEEDGHTLPLTSDLRVHLGAEVRARF